LAEIFGDIQLKFYLVRLGNSYKVDQSKYREILLTWKRYFLDNFPSIPKSLDAILQVFDTSILFKYGKYFYPRVSYLQYIKSWNTSTVDLITWKKFKYLTIPDEIYFLKKIFELNGGITFPKDHMRKLFNKYIDEIFNNEFQPRMMSTEISQTEKPETFQKNNQVAHWLN
jgi:hypothetical protein